MAAALSTEILAEAFAYEFRFVVESAFMLLALVLMLWAFIHVIFQRTDAFTAIGSLQKIYWLLILGGCFLLTLVGFPFVKFIGIGAAAIYLLDVRRGLKDAAEGHW